MIEPILLYSLIFGVSLICLVMAIITFSYRRLLKKFYEIWKEEEGVKKARETAQEIVNQANISASKILADANIFANNERQILTSNLESVSSREVSDFEKMLSEIKEEAREALVSEISKVSLNLSSQIQQEFVKAENDAQAYKKVMIDRVDLQIYKVIQEVSQSVLGKKLSIDEQDEIVINELEGAKKRNAI